MTAARGRKGGIQSPAAPRDAPDPDRSQPLPRRPWVGTRHFDLRYVALAAVAIVVACLALMPVGTMVFASLRTTFLSIGPSHWTLSHYATVADTSDIRGVILNTVLYAVPTMAISVILGFGLAWLVVRTNTPGRGVMTVVTLLPLVIPGILNTVAWSLLLSPRIGPINTLLHVAHLPTFNVYTIPGMVFVQSTHEIPLAFLMGLATFAAFDPSLEEAALASGSGMARAFWSITMRIARPAVISAGLLVLIQTVSSFEVPQLIGTQGSIYVFVNYMYSALNRFPPDYGTVGSLGTIVLVICSVCLLASRRAGNAAAYQTISGKAFRSTVMNIGRWRWLSLVAFVLVFVIEALLPLAILVWTSLLPGYESPSLSALRDITLKNYREVVQVPSISLAIENSLITAISAAVLATLISAAVAYIVVRTRIRGSSLLELLATSPIAVPSIVLGIGILYFCLVVPLPVRIYGTLKILIIAFVTIALPYCVRYMVSGISMIKDELEEAGAVSGASWLQILRRIYVPLLRPSLVVAFLYAMILAFREVSAAVFLYSEPTQVVATKIFEIWTDGNVPVAAALGVILAAALGILVAVVRRIGGRFGISN